MSNTLHDYIKETQKQITAKGADGAEMVFDPNVSDTMILCHSIMSQYAKEKKLSKLPCPMSINSKSLDGKESFTVLKFDPDLDCALLTDIFTRKGYPETCIEEYNASVNIEIFNKK
jgi:hypothetical protein